MKIKFGLSIFFLTTVSAVSAKPFHNKKTGLYLSKDKKLSAQIIAKWEGEPDLFVPQKAFLEVHYRDLYKHAPSGVLELSPTEDGRLEASQTKTCDDPGCYEYDLHIALQDDASLQINYHWFRHEDDGAQATQGSGSRLALRAFVGIETPLATREPLQAPPLKEMIYKSLAGPLKNIDTSEEVVLSSSLEDTQFEVYKKAFLPDEKLSALFVLSSLQFKTSRRAGPAQCASVLSKTSKGWKLAYTRCTGAAFPKPPF